MKISENHGRSSPRKGLFLFFVLGLFMLQIGFAFTTHGDIGPHGMAAPGLNRPASPALVGKIDSLISSTGGNGTAHPTPVVALAQAVKPALTVSPLLSGVALVASAKARKDSTRVRGTAMKYVSSGSSVSKLDERGGRYLEYTIHRGDTLDTIARRLYGNPRMVTALIRLNRLTSDRNLRCGEKLRVPRSGLIATASR
ncbi:MAG: LysM peptidoglycan-binding domain-containing protein [Candidatus Ozemobacteraceae bacterium]